MQMSVDGELENSLPAWKKTHTWLITYVLASHKEFMLQLIIYSRTGASLQQLLACTIAKTSSQGSQTLSNNCMVEISEESLFSKGKFPQPIISK